MPLGKLLVGAGLFVAMLLFGTVTAYKVWQIKTHNTQLSERTYETPWSLIQLQLEMGRFLDAVRLRHANALSEDDFLLRYDILWSRTPILLNNKSTFPLNNHPDLYLLIEQITARIHALEEAVLSFTPNSPTYLTILSELSPYMEPLSRGVTTVMQDNVQHYAQLDQVDRKLDKQLQIQLIGLLTTLGLLLILLFRVLFRYWRMQQKNSPNSTSKCNTRFSVSQLIIKDNTGLFKAQYFPGPVI